MTDMTGPESIGDGQDPSLGQVLKGLGGRSLLGMIRGAAEYYEYASADPDDMRSLIGKIKTETPPLGELRDVFSDHLIDLSENLQPPVTTPGAPKVMQGEFDITLLTFFMFKGLREPLQTLDPHSKLTEGFAEAVEMSDINDLDQIMPELSNRSVALWTLSAGLAQNALRRITGEADRPWNPSEIPSLPAEQQAEYYRRRYAQQVCILTVAKSLELLD
jgi:hypothetical protein